MITITETPHFTKKAEKLLSADEKVDLISMIALNPEAGDIIPKTGGVRKLRYAREGQGKSGSYRVIYYYYNENNPVRIFTIFGKNEQSNLSDAQKNELYDIVQNIKKDTKHDKSR